MWGVTCVTYMYVVLANEHPIHYSLYLGLRCEKALEVCFIIPKLNHQLEYEYSVAFLWASSLCLCANDGKINIAHKTNHTINICIKCMETGGAQSRTLAYWAAGRSSLWRLGHHHHHWPEKAGTTTYLHAGWWGCMKTEENGQFRKYLSYAASNHPPSPLSCC